MSAKYIKLWGRSIGMNKVDKFKWQWAIKIEMCRNLKAAQPLWEPHLIQSPNWTRKEARIMLASYKHNPSIRNAHLVRRLVQVNWQDYSDTFTYNAKGNGNGR